MNQELTGKKVAILVADGFEQVEMTEPRRALEDAGAVVDLVSPNPDVVRAWDHADWGDTFGVDVQLGGADLDSYDALMLPGGVMNPDKLRMNAAALDFIRTFFEAGKPVAAICHAPWTLIEAGVVRNRKLTSYGSLRTDLKNAGAMWVDQAVVVDKGLITSRRPDDLPQFLPRMIEEFCEGIHLEQKQATQQSLGI